MLSYLDIYYLLGWAALALLPVVLLLNKSPPSAGQHALIWPAR